MPGTPPVACGRSRPGRAHMVLFFPDQHLSADEHLAFGRLFGELEAHPNLDLERERPEFFELRATDGHGGIADEWHSDITCEHHPSKFAVLQAKVVPDVGGDTMWSNACKAYDELSAPLRDLCDAESALLLGHLTPWVQQPRFTVRYRWTAGTIAMWDNRCTQHHVLNDFEGERMIQRVTVMGDDPRPAEPLPRWEPYGAKTATFWRDTEMRRQLSAQRSTPT